MLYQSTKGYPVSGFKTLRQQTTAIIRRIERDRRELDKSGTKPRVSKDQSTAEPIQGLQEGCI